MAASDRVERRTRPGTAHIALSRRVRGPACALLATCGALLMAACGSSTMPRAGTATGGGHSTALVSFSVCMRSHGVSDFPDPGAAIEGPYNSIGGIAIPPAIDMRSPAFQTGLGVCRSRLGAVFSRQGKPPITASLKASLIAHAQCMRTHGIPTYPDPAFPAGGGIEITDAPGVNPQSPAYLHSQAVCVTR
jgi:hypothetical protein